MDPRILDIARRTLQLEADSIRELLAFVNDDFARVLELVSASQGRLVVSGIGKSAIIAQKMVATLNSTGTPSLFLHAADAIHGDLGMVQQHDVVMIISKSGESPEIKVLVPLIRNFGNPVIAMTGNLQSFLARNSDYILNTTVRQEACPNNLAPTTSTTAQMAMGDALAVCLMEMKGFSSEDFARFHPGGMLGKQLYLRVSDLYPVNGRPAVQEQDVLRRVIMEITRNGVGATAVLNEQQEISGVITDGDLRRMLEMETDLMALRAKEIMTANPKTIDADALAVVALDTMRKHNISQLLVTRDGEYQGILHLHDLVKEGLI